MFQIYHLIFLIILATLYNCQNLPKYPSYASCSFHSSQNTCLGILDGCCYWNLNKTNCADSCPSGDVCITKDDAGCDKTTNAKGLLIFFIILLSIIVCCCSICCCFFFCYGLYSLIVTYPEFFGPILDKFKKQNYQTL